MKIKLSLNSFFILETYKKEYVFSNFPYDDWKNSETVTLFGWFFNQEIGIS